MNNWISVNDRMPEEKGNIVVLIGGELQLASVQERGYCCSIYIEPFAIYELGQLYTRDSQLKLLDKPFRGVGKWILPAKWKDPTHWMPLPERPSLDAID